MKVGNCLSGGPFVSLGRMIWQHEALLDSMAT